MHKFQRGDHSLPAVFSDQSVNSNPYIALLWTRLPFRFEGAMEVHGDWHEGGNGRMKVQGVCL